MLLPASRALQRIQFRPLFCGSSPLLWLVWNLHPWPLIQTGIHNCPSSSPSFLFFFYIYCHAHCHRLLFIYSSSPFLPLCPFIIQNALRQAVPSPVEDAQERNFPIWAQIGTQQWHSVKWFRPCQTWRGHVDAYYTSNGLYRFPQGSYPGLQSSQRRCKLSQVSSRETDQQLFFHSHVTTSKFRERFVQLQWAGQVCYRCAAPADVWRSPSC